MSVRLLALCVALVAGLAPAPAAASARPNVIVVMTDDQTYDDMEAMPHTQQLIGAQGATFTRSYVSYPLCCPSRATYLTGQYAHNNGVRSTTPPDGGVEALDEDRTLPVWLQRAGYRTSHVGKYLNGYGLRQPAYVPPGWDDWHGAIDKTTYQMWGYRLFENGTPITYGDYWTEDPALYQTDVLRDKALQFIDAQAGGADPFFLSLAFVAPHGEVVPPQTTTQPYIRPAPRHRGGVFDASPLAAPSFSERDTRDKPRTIRRLRGVSARQQLRIATDRQARRASLMAVDEAVRAIVAQLERTGELGSTYLLFTSDNGFFEGQHRIAKGKYFAYDPASRVPLLVRGPGIAPGTISDELVVNADLAPTILDVAGAQATVTQDGRSLLRFAAGGASPSRRAVLHEGLVGGDNDREDGAASRTGLRTYAAVRTRRYLYVEWADRSRELYDLRTDPFQLRSRHRDRSYAHVRWHLAAALGDLRDCAGAGCRRSVAPVAPLPVAPPADRRSADALGG